MSTAAALPPQSGFYQLKPLIFDIPVVLFGNRLCPLNIKILPPDASGTTCYRAIITSTEDMSIYLENVIECPAAEPLIQCLKQMKEDSEKDTSVVKIRIERSYSADSSVYTMFVESRGQALQIPLYSPSPEILTAYLLDVIHKERNQLQTERRQNKELTKELEKTKIELDKLHEKYSWQEKELELLKMVVKSPVANSHNHVVASEHPQTSRSMRPQQKVLETQPSSRAGNEHIITLAEDDEMGGPSNHYLNRLEMTSNDGSSASNEPLFIKKDEDKRLPNVTSNPASQTSQELLLGIAQYILCTLCPEEMKGVKEMEDHFMSQHIDKEKQNCEACPSEQPTDITKHIQMHTNRIYACIFCGKRGRKNYLKSHIRKHTGERPFSCDTCGRDFSDSSTLRRHRLVHSGEKKHICPICGRGIARKDNVKSHLKSHKMAGEDSSSNFLYSKGIQNESDTN